MIEQILLAQRRPYVILGIFGTLLIVVFLGLDIVVRTVPAETLFVWQVVSGLLLVLLIVYQWVLLFVRISGANTQTHYKAHRWVGVTCTALFAFHAISYGHGWTNGLAIVFVLSALTGLLNREVVTYRKPWAYKLWYCAHVTLSVSLLPLIAVHIWIALAYEGIEMLFETR